MNDNYDLNAIFAKNLSARTAGPKVIHSNDRLRRLLNDRFDTTEFSRSPGSGAFATTHSLPDHLKNLWRLNNPTVKFKFCIECKKGYNNQNLYSLYNYSSEIWKFIEQSEKDAGKVWSYTYGDL